MKKFGFTLIELMVVVLIVAVLAALLVPMLMSRVEAAKMSEGKAIAGTIATAVRAWIAETDVDYDDIPEEPSLTGDLGFKANELDGKYYTQTDTTITGVAATSAGQISYVITVNSRTNKVPDVILTCTSTNDYNPTFSVP